MIHIFSGKWPEPQVGQTQVEEGKLIPITEAERREVFLKAIEENHPLMDLIHRCINNDPQLRPHAGEIIRRVNRVATQFPASFANRLEMLRQIERERREKSALTEEGERKDKVIQDKNDEILINKREILALSEEGERKDGIILQKENEISSLRKETQAEKEQKTIDMERFKFSYSIEVEQLKLQLKDMETQNQYTKAKNEAEIVELKTKYSALETRSKIILEEIQQSVKQLIKEREQLEIQLGKEKQLLTEEKEANKKLMLNVSRLQSDITDKKTAIQMKEAVIIRNYSELEAKSRALGEKDATISAMSEQITKIREYLATKPQVSQLFAGIIRFWRFVSTKFCKSRQILIFYNNVSRYKTYIWGAFIVL
jgi:DNA repair exonuclease SbcCD ATPase subunit